jgi:hypothetical protein
MKKRTVTVYEKDDIEALDKMTKEDVIKTLKSVKDGWLPRDYILVPEDGEEYTEAQYDTTKLHIAIGKAIAMLEG